MWPDAGGGVRATRGEGKRPSQEPGQNEGRRTVDARLWEWAETLRGVRNAAAHFNNETVSRQDAEDVVAYSEALLDYLYVLKARFEAMRARRSS